MKFHPDICLKLKKDIPEGAADALAYVELAGKVNSSEDSADALNKAAARFRVAAEDCLAAKLSACPPQPVPPRPQATQPARLPPTEREKRLLIAGEELADLVRKFIDTNAATERVSEWEQVLVSLNLNRIH